MVLAGVLGMGAEAAADAYVLLLLCMGSDYQTHLQTCTSVACSLLLDY
jgi:hypothetical protein